MTQYLDMMEVYDFTAESLDINEEIGAFVKGLIDRNQYGQCMLEVSSVLTDMETMMNRFGIDGDENIANRAICYPEVEEIMTSYLTQRTNYIRKLDEERKSN